MTSQLPWRGQDELLQIYQAASKYDLSSGFPPHQRYSCPENPRHWPCAETPEPSGAIPGTRRKSLRKQ